MKAYRFDKADSDTVVVFIHGIIEGPNQFEDFIKRANKGVGVVNLLLPGHGGDGKAFAQSSMNEWKQHVFDAVDGLQQEYKHIILVGHSMGTLLAIECARKYPEYIGGLILLAVPVCIRLKYAGMINSMKVALDLVKEEDTIAVAARNAYSIERQSLVHYITWAPRYIELFKQAYTARNQIGKLEVPIFIFQSAQDEFVSMKSLKYLKKNERAQISILEQSGHFYYLPEERERILRCFEELLKLEKIKGRTEDEFNYKKHWEE